MITREKIIFEVIVWDALHLAVDEMKARRNCLMCIDPEYFDPEYLDIWEFRRTKCWEEDEREPYCNGQDLAGNRRGWCDPCTERQRLHEEIGRLIYKRAGALKRLRALVRKYVAEGET